VLHGGSGIPAALVQQAIVRGICKLNVATETKDTFMRALKIILASSDEIDLRTIFPVATSEVSKVIMNKLSLVSLSEKYS
jgi:fructose-bisphosphate aldolase class II/tagatose 1,6-diphosphate aldolase GatY/KbaY